MSHVVVWMPAVGKTFPGWPDRSGSDVWQPRRINARPRQPDQPTLSAYGQLSWSRSSRPRRSGTLVFRTAD